MTAFKKLVAAVAVATTTAVGAIGTAQAGDYHSRPYGGGYGPGPGHYRAAPPPPPVYHHHERRRDRTGEKIAKGVAIGVGAIILGSILANQARRNRY